MHSVAFVFPGQGSQAVGMGGQLGEGSPRWAEAEAALGFDLQRLCLEGPEADLKLTANTQPAILTVSVIALDALTAAGVRCAFVAGHSLGEYTALVAAGALAFADAVRVVRARGQFMQEAVPVGEGAMAAVMGLDRTAIGEACREAAEAGPVQLANLNAPGQTVIAGAAAAVTRAAERCKAKGAKRAVLLPVSAPFHSSLLAPAAARLHAVLEAVPFAELCVPLVTNVDAEPLTDRTRLVETLVRQVTAAVRWEDVVLRLGREGVDTFVEVGPGKVLSGLIKRIAPDARVVNVEDRESLAASLEVLR